MNNYCKYLTWPPLSWPAEGDVSLWKLQKWSDIALPNPTPERCGGRGSLTSTSDEAYWQFNNSACAANQWWILAFSTLWCNIATLQKCCRVCVCVCVHVCVCVCVLVFFFSVYLLMSYRKRSALAIRSSSCLCSSNSSMSLFSGTYLRSFTQTHTHKLSVHLISSCNYLSDMYEPKISKNV